MLIKKDIFLALMGLIAFIDFAAAQTTATEGLYRITSGAYIECCGIAGPLRTSLPNASQAFVRLTIDRPGNTATMTFLGEDMQTIFRAATCPPGGTSDFNFPGGLLFPDRLIFHVDPGPAPCHIYWNYTASNSTDRLVINGTLGSSIMFGSDIPDRFTHTNVVAVLMPAATIRVSEFEICWHAISNRTYQIQYRSEFTTNEWTNLGPARPGDGATNCMTDKVPRGEAHRFYRVLLVP